MTAHSPITAARAVAMVEAIGVADAQRLIADRTTAALVKSYALVIEITEINGPRSSVRGAAVSTELWRRMIAEGVTEDVWDGGTVRLASSGLVGGLPEVSITGFEFERKGIARLVEQLRGHEPKAAVRRPVAKLAVEEDT